MAVAAGILLSRLAGFVRERALAHYLGNSPASGAFRAALRIPNLLQNLLGEGVLSASFIPVYAKLLAEGKEDEANRVARTVATLLFFAAAVITLLGVVFTRAAIELLAPGFHGEVRELTIHLVQILFPGTALLVLSAWCLGVLNSHRKFFLSYVSPVVWNGALIAVAIVGGRRLLTPAGGQFELAVWLAWGAVAGSGLQLLVQVPTVFALTRSLLPSLRVKSEGVQATLRAFGPVLVGRGSVQLSSYLDQLLASYLGPAMVSAMAYAQTLYLLPVSLFGMSISAAELPEMSRAQGSSADIAAKLQERLKGGLRNVVFLVVPSMVAFLAIGPTLVGAIFQSGRFQAQDTWEVWVILCGSAVGLTAGTQGRLLASAFYALGDTKTPLHAALVRVALTFVSGWAAALPLRAHYGYAPVYGALGLTASAGVAAWMEFSLLRLWLGKRIGRVPLPMGLLAMATFAAAVAGVGGFLLQRTLAGFGPWIRAGAVVPTFCAIYLVLGLALKIPEATQLVNRVRRKLGR
ncbi:MAG: murein biosynthesis integral membrane protein MurJ [Deltaproteobacteria bacterium]|nr:murein biosynthesis integral membrane protein MurJ [Deltaproteobacteria bacterium]